MPFLCFTSIADTLVALRRIINPSRWLAQMRPSWGWLLFSALIHLAVLDAVSLPQAGRAEGVSRLRGVLLAQEREASPGMPVAAQTVSPRVPVDRQPDPVARKVNPMERLVPEVRARPAEALQPAQAGEQSSGDAPLFRPLSPDEGLVAYRLALLAAMPADWPALPGGHLRIELAFGPGGLLETSRVLEPEGRRADAWQAFIARAVTQAALPEVLLGSGFRLELEMLD